MARAVVASDVLDAVRRKAGDDRAEQIAHAIEALAPFAKHKDYRYGFLLACERAARIARETR